MEDWPENSNIRHLICTPGTMIGDLKVLRKLGEGTYATVYEVVDLKINKRFAMKASMNGPIHRHIAQREITYLHNLQSFDEESNLCVKVFMSFELKGHICILLEKLGSDFLTFVKKKDFYPLPMAHVRHITFQLVCCLHFIHSKGVIHSDLKTDNVLFVDSSCTQLLNVKERKKILVLNNTEIRVIDFGCARDDKLLQNGIMNNECYRAPEVILKSNWSHPVDVWSLGCIIYELITGDLLFNVEKTDDLEHLAIIEKIIGPFPLEMTNNPALFEKGTGKVRSNTVDGSCHDPLTTIEKFQGAEGMQLVDLLKKMLAINPAARITMKDALNHPFFDILPVDASSGLNLKN